jgi:hypothetical protein
MIETQATPFIVADEKAGRRLSGPGRRQEGEGKEIRERVIGSGEEQTWIWTWT